MQTCHQHTSQSSQLSNTYQIVILAINIPLRAHNSQIPTRSPYLPSTYLSHLTTLKYLPGRHTCHQHTSHISQLSNTYQATILVINIPLTSHNSQITARSTVLKLFKAMDRQQLYVVVHGSVMASAEMLNQKLGNPGEHCPESACPPLPPRWPAFILSRFLHEPHPFTNDYNKSVKGIKYFNNMRIASNGNNKKL